MTATHCLSKPLNVFTPQAHKPTILNLHPNNVTILSSSISGGNWRMLRQEMRLRDHLQPTESMGLSGPDPEVVAMKRPITRMCMCQNKRVPSWRSLTLEFLRGGTAPSEVLLVAKRARLTPHLLDDAERKFKEILLQDRVDFEHLQKCAGRMEMSRKEDAAVIELLEYLRKCEGPHEIYEAKLVLVEMLIYQGDYERARQTLEDVERDGSEQDARPPFYLAVVCVLLGKGDEAEKHWGRSKSRLAAAPPVEAPPDEAPPDGIKTPMVETFREIKDHVEVLGQEITAVRSTTHKEKK